MWHLSKGIYNKESSLHLIPLHTSHHNVYVFSWHLGTVIYTARKPSRIIKIDFTPEREIHIFSLNTCMTGHQMELVKRMPWLLIQQQNIYIHSQNREISYNHKHFVPFDGEIRYIWMRAFHHTFEFSPL